MAKVTIAPEVAKAPVWPVGTVALVNKKNARKQIDPYPRMHVGTYDPVTNQPNPTGKVVNLATGSIRPESTDDYVVHRVLDTITVS